MEANSRTVAARSGVCDLELLDIRAEPYPHVVCETFIEPEHYRQLCRTFPVCPPGKGLRRVMHEPQELWVRMDIHQGRVGYDRIAHVDYARRLVSMLIYFCDQDENQMVGGELFLHGQNAERIAPRHNPMVAFPCANNSLHSVAKVTAATAPRNYLHVFISSSADIWPRQAPGLWRRVLSSFKHRLAEVRSSGSLIP